MDVEVTESQILAASAQREYDALSAEERAKVDEQWAKMSEWDKEQLRAAVEFDLL